MPITTLFSNSVTFYCNIFIYFIFQPKVVALGNTAIPVVTTPIAPNTSKANTGARPSLVQPKFITTTNIKNGSQPIQSAGPGSITLIQVCYIAASFRIPSPKYTPL